MQKPLLSVLPAISILLAIALPAHAQTSRYYDESRITLNAGFGFTIPVQDANGRIDGGWHVTAGGGYQFNEYFALTGEYSYYNFDIDTGVLGPLGVSDGDANMMSVTGNLSGRVGSRSPVGLYFIGGGGVYRRQVKFEQLATPGVPVPPWFGNNLPPTVPGSGELGPFTTWSPGWNFGGGVTFGLGGETRLFVEWRYHYVFTPNTKTQFMPVTVGVRW
jgi:Outer membrane protein beta-barrel domain